MRPENLCRSLDRLTQGERHLEKRIGRYYFGGAFEKLISSHKNKTRLGTAKDGKRINEVLGEKPVRFPSGQKRTTTYTNTHCSGTYFGFQSTKSEGTFQGAYSKHLRSRI